MITLKTLPTATEQEVFDQVATHLIRQCRKSLKEQYLLRPISAYRGGRWYKMRRRVFNRG